MPRLSAEATERRRESLGRSQRDSCILARLLRGAHAVTLCRMVRHPISSGVVAADDNALGLTVVRSAELRPCGSKTHERGAATLTPRAESSQGGDPTPRTWCLERGRLGATPLSADL